MSSERPCVQDREGLWHAMFGEFDDTFTRIVCGEQDGTGINLPGPDEVRSPTCPSCLAAEHQRIEAA